MIEFPACPETKVLRAIVTGAAEGIGAQCARALARDQVQIVVADIDKVPLARLANEIGAHAIACDVLSEHSVKALIGQSVDALAAADLLINAAGNGYVRALGMMRVSCAFAAAAQNPATIVNVATAHGGVEQFGYAGSKRAFQRLSEGLGNKLSDRAIAVLAIDHLADEAEVNKFIAQLCRSARSPVIRGAADGAGG